MTKLNLVPEHARREPNLSLTVFALSRHRRILDKNKISYDRNLRAKERNLESPPLIYHAEIQSATPVSVRMFSRCPAHRQSRKVSGWRRRMVRRPILEWAPW